MPEDLQALLTGGVLFLVTTELYLDVIAGAGFVVTRLGGCIRVDLLLMPGLLIWAAVSTLVLRELGVKD